MGMDVDVNMNVENGNQIPDMEVNWMFNIISFHLPFILYKLSIPLQWHLMSYWAHTYVSCNRYNINEINPLMWNHNSGYNLGFTIHFDARDHTQTQLMLNATNQIT